MGIKIMHYRARQIGAKLKFLPRSEGGHRSAARNTTDSETMNMLAAKAKVMLVDDHPILRHGMAMLINSIEQP
jgi:hypothetical protein